MLSLNDNISNWSSSVRFQPAKIYRPTSIPELATFVRQSSGRIRVVGGGHSFTPLIKTEDTLISLDHLQALRSFDENTGIVQMEAGARLRKANQEMHKLGRSLENLGDIDRQSLAGAMSTGTHGTGKKFGTLSTQLKRLRILKADSEIVELDADKNPDEFRVAQTSLGALGILLELGLQTVPAYDLICAQQVENLETVLGQFIDNNEKHRHFEFFWFPFTDVAVTKRSDLCDSARSPSKIKRFVTETIFENLLLDTLNRGSAWRPSAAPAMNRMLMRLARLGAQSLRSGKSYEVFATERWVRFQEMEYGIPVENFAAAFRDLKEHIERRRFPVSFPIEVRYVKGDQIPLSPAYGGDRVFIAVHMYRGMQFHDFFREAEEIFLSHQGRPHWGKMHHLGRETLENLYPEWKLFQKIRSEFDPNGTFRNEHLEELFD